MKLWMYVFAIFLATTEPVAAKELWLLIKRDDNYVIQRVGADGAAPPSTTLGYAPTFGDSSTSIVFLSRDVGRDSSTLTIVDKSTGSTVTTWPVAAQPVPRHSGPFRGLVVVSGYAYFASIRYGPQGDSLVPNEDGGVFDFNRVSLSTGALDRFPLPLEVRDPRVVDYSGTPLVYGFNSAGIWKFDKDAARLVPIASRLDVADSLALAADAPLPELTAGRFSDYISVPGAGVFRYSRFGKLSRFLDSQLSLDTTSSATLSVADIGARGKMLETFLGHFDDKDYIGLVSEEKDAWRLQFLDPQSLQVVSDNRLPKSAILETTFVAPDGSVYFVDGAQNSIQRLAEGAISVAVSLDDVDAARFDSSLRILLVH